jgi:hypothetical protein
MQEAAPAAVLVQIRGSEKWTLELREFKAFREAIGPDVMNAFCRCFVHSDRLTSLISFAYVSQKHHGRESRAFGRNLQTMVWFTVGTLRELAVAIRDLRSALAKRKKLNPDSEPWKKLRAVEKRWEDDPFYREMRNIAAFHVDPEIVEKGLVELAKERTVILSEGESRKSDASSIRIGLEALFNGCGKDLDDFGTFMSTVGEDHDICGAIEEAFLLAVEDAGLETTREER